MSLFPADVIAAAQASHRKFWPKGPFVSVTLAQWALESGYGAHQSGKNNFFGITANPAQIAARQFTMRSTKEQRADGSWYVRNAAFADYASLTDCFDAHARLLTTPHYQLCMDAATVEAYCLALRECGYATALEYPGKLISIINRNGLRRYDQRL